MSFEAKLMCGIILLTVPSIQYGGFFLVSVLSGGYERLSLNDFQKNMFRAGHAHAGVLVILSLVCQILADQAELSQSLVWMVRAFMPASALLISGGFFFSALGKGVSKPTGMVGLIYIGIALLAIGTLTLGIGLLRSL